MSVKALVNGARVSYASLLVFPWVNYITDTGSRDFSFWELNVGAMFSGFYWPLIIMGLALLGIKFIEDDRFFSSTIVSAILLGIASSFLLLTMTFAYSGRAGLGLGAYLLLGATAVSFRCSRRLALDEQSEMFEKGKLHVEADRPLAQRLAIAGGFLTILVGVGQPFGAYTRKNHPYSDYVLNPNQYGDYSFSLFTMLKSHGVWASAVALVALLVIVIVKALQRRSALVEIVVVTFAFFVTTAALFAAYGNRIIEDNTLYHGAYLILLGATVALFAITPWGKKVLSPRNRVESPK